MTGAKVYSKIISQSGKIYEYNSKKVTYNTTETQTDNVDGLSPLSTTESRPVSLEVKNLKKRKRKSERNHKREKEL